MSLALTGTLPSLSGNVLLPIGYGRAQGSDLLQGLSLPSPAANLYRTRPDTASPSTDDWPWKKVFSDTANAPSVTPLSLPPQTSEGELPLSAPPCDEADTGTSVPGDSQPDTAVQSDEEGRTPSLPSDLPSRRSLAVKAAGPSPSEADTEENKVPTLQGKPFSSPSDLLSQGPLAAEAATSPISEVQSESWGNVASGADKLNQILSRMAADTRAQRQINRAFFTLDGLVDKALARKSESLSDEDKKEMDKVLDVWAPREYGREKGQNGGEPTSGVSYDHRKMEAVNNMCSAYTSLMTRKQAHLKDAQEILCHDFPLREDSYALVPVPNGMVILKTDETYPVFHQGNEISYVLAPNVLVQSTNEGPVFLPGGGWVEVRDGSCGGRGRVASIPLSKSETKILAASRSNAPSFMRVVDVPHSREGWDSVFGKFYQPMRSVAEQEGVSEWKTLIEVAESCRKAAASKREKLLSNVAQTSTAEVEQRPINEDLTVASGGKSTE